MTKKMISGYCEPLSLRAGDPIQYFASSKKPITAKIDLVRIICGDPSRSGPGFKEIAVASELPQEVILGEQTITPGSYAEIDFSDLRIDKEFSLDVHVYPTRLTETQTLLELSGDGTLRFALELHDQRFVFLLNDTEVVLSQDRVREKHWYRLKVKASLGGDGTIATSLECLPSCSPGRDLSIESNPVSASANHMITGHTSLQRCLIAASSSGNRYDGRIARPKIKLDEITFEWDFAKEISGRTIVDVSGHQRHGLLHQLPARAVTGPGWNGSEHVWKTKPEHYDAIHFHSDDLYDAGWQTTAALTLPATLASGIYAFRVTSEDEIERVPFFVRPPADAATADIALLMSSCTYIAYANHRMLFEGADFVSARATLRPEHEYVRDHPELGPSMYEKHSDGSGVMYSSRRRPIMQLRPGADGWNFTPDTNINAFMEHLELNHDVIADEDVHSEGIAALEPYRVIVTGSHPEYWSTQMIEALEQWQRNGGRLLYLGGNGFYWRVAFSDAWPGAIELRRAEDGVRNWQTETGESYHSFNGEYGGLWRRLGRPPNELVGVGFAAQGFERATGYRRTPASYDSRAAWIFAGVEDEMIGTSGLGGGAAGQEVDRYNEALGSPSHAVILASATDFGSDMTRTKEELDAAIVVPSPDPVVRADIVFFETPAGGAVFSVSSISWFGALARNKYHNDVAQITENVLRRFLDPTAFSYSPKSSSEEMP